MSETTPQRPVIRNAGDIEGDVVGHGKGAVLKVIVGPREGLPSFVMREFTIGPGGFIKSHNHADLEHGQAMLEGEMVLILDGAEHVVRAGDFMSIPAGVPHRYENRTDRPLRFLCVIPATPDYQTEWLE